VIREVLQSDTPNIVRLLQEVEPDVFRSEAGFRHRLANEPQHARRRSWCALEGGQLVGWATGAFGPSSERKHLAWLAVAVDPGHRGQGIGGKLYTRVHAHLVEHGAWRLRAQARDEPASRHFAEKRRYALTGTERGAKLDPRKVDLGALESLARAKEQEGFALASLGALRDRAETVYDLDQAIRRDLGGPYADIGLEEWKEALWEHPDVSFDGSFVALEGERAVSFAMLRADPEHGRALHDMTGTLAELRRRGLARLVKLASIRWAAENGITSIVTDYDDGNQPILALNESLGFEPFESELSYVRNL
jgi:GNAT superfamily N-acetyltransferase